MVLRCRRRGRGRERGLYGVRRGRRVQHRRRQGPVRRQRLVRVVAVVVVHVRVVVVGRRVVVVVVAATVAVAGAHGRGGGAGGDRGSSGGVVVVVMGGGGAVMVHVKPEVVEGRVAQAGCAQHVHPEVKQDFNCFLYYIQKLLRFQMNWSFNFHYLESNIKGAWREVLRNIRRIFHNEDGIFTCLIK